MSASIKLVIVLLTVWVLAMLGLWFMAAATLSEHDPATLVVFGAPHPQARDAAFRVMAFDSQKKRRVTNTNTISVTTQGGTGTVVGERALVPQGMVLHAGGTLEGHALEVPLTETEAENKLRFSPWTDALIRGPNEPHLYPEFGQVQAHMEQTLWARHSEGDAKPVTFQYGPSEARIGDQWIKLSRSGITLRAPFQTREGRDWPLEFNLREKSYLALELLADGFVVDFIETQIPQGASTLMLSLSQVPSGTRLVSVHAFRSPFSKALAASAHAGFEGKTLAQALSSHLSSDFDKTLADLAKAKTEGFKRAQLSRFFWKRTRAPRLSTTAEVQKSTFAQAREARSARFRTPFRALGLVLSLVLFLTAIIFARKIAGPHRSRRGLALGALGLALGLGGLWVLDYALSLLSNRLP